MMRDDDDGGDVPSITLICQRLICESCGREDEMISSAHSDPTDLALPASLFYLIDRPRVCGLCATTSTGALARV